MFCLGGFWQGGFLSRGFLSGGLCPGGFCLGFFCPSTFSATIEDLVLIFGIAQFHDQFIILGKFRENLRPSVPRPAKIA